MRRNEKPWAQRALRHEPSSGSKNLRFNEYTGGNHCPSDIESDDDDDDPDSFDERKVRKFLRDREDTDN
jgi:hypothetical protein